MKISFMLLAGDRNNTARICCRITDQIESMRIAQGDVLVVDGHNRVGMRCNMLLRALLVVVPGHVVAQVLPALRSLRVGLQSRVGRSR